jgi:hypothetical protein
MEFPNYADRVWADPHRSEHRGPAMYNLEVVFSLCAHFRARQHVGEWLSLVEHLVRDQGVGGSNPLSPTNYLNPVIELASFPFPSFRELQSTCVG